MALYYTDFSEYTAGSPPDDWTHDHWSTDYQDWDIIGDSGTLGDQYLETENTSTNERDHLFVWDKIDDDNNRDNVEIVAKLRTNKGYRNQNRLYVRASGSENDETAYYAELYNNDTFYVRKEVNGSISNLNSISYSFFIDTWYWMRLRVNGSDIKAKVWEDGETEPESWDIEETDTGITGTGWVGVGGYIHDSIRDFDVVGVATNGDAAPAEPIAYVSTDAATNIKFKSATLKGELTKLLGLDEVDCYFRYRETGESTWNETTKQTLTEIGTFEQEISGLTGNTEYEYKVVAEWDSGTEENTGSTVTFTTDVIGLFNPLPRSYEETDIEENKFSARIETAEREGTFFLSSSFPAQMKYWYKSELTVEIADNKEFTDSNTFTSKRTISGNRASITATLEFPGRYYIRMQAEDAAGNKTDWIEYEVYAVQSLYFIETPSVDTSSPKATHIIVQSDTSEATASLSGTEEDEKVERLIEIEEGDESTCQKVADELLDRWGRKQTTISGDVNLTITFDFEEKAKVIIEEADIESSYVVQNIRHDVLQKRTTIEIGDSRLDDNEILARILDDM
ncbi:MAG: hypothetical protein ACQEQD_04435 [Bacillota bacterium]